MNYMGVSKYIKSRKLKGRTIKREDILYFNHNQPSWQYSNRLRDFGYVQTIDEKRVELRIIMDGYWEYVWFDDDKLFFENKLDKKTKNK